LRRRDSPARAELDDERLHSRPRIGVSKWDADVRPFCDRCVRNDASPRVAADERGAEVLSLGLSEQFQPCALEAYREHDFGLELLQVCDVRLERLGVLVDRLRRDDTTAEPIAERPTQSTSVGVVLIP
jgi:hypothetical protein